MGADLARRGLRTAIVLPVALVAVFYGLRLAPRDPTGGVLSPTVLEEVRAEYRERLGLNEQILVQYGVYVKNLA